LSTSGVEIVLPRAAYSTSRYLGSLRLQPKSISAARASVPAQVDEIIE